MNANATTDTTANPSDIPTDTTSPRLFRGAPFPLVALVALALLTVAIACSFARPSSTPAAEPAIVSAASAVAAAPATNSVALSSSAVAAPRAQAIGTACPCPQPRYLRTSSSTTIAKGYTYVEADTDAGQPITVTLPASPDPLERHEIWLGAQPGIPSGSLTVDPNGQPVALAPGLSLTIPATSPNTGLVLLFVQPQPPPAGGYWRVSAL